MAKLTFYLEAFPDDGSLGESVNHYVSEGVAVSRALAMAKRLGQPVDVRYPAGASENERYIGTASPSEHHAKGARFSRSELRG